MQFCLCQIGKKCETRWKKCGNEETNKMKYIYIRGYYTAIRCYGLNLYISTRIDLKNKTLIERNKIRFMYHTKDTKML